MIKNEKISKNQEAGFASIVITLLLIIVLALLTTGFSQLARNEQQNALNKQLANQAYYAAETGINDTIKDISANNINNQTPNVNTNSCIHPATGFTSHQNIDAQTGVSYRCLTVYLNPGNIYYTNVGSGVGHHITFEVIDSNNNPVTLNSLTVQWSSTDGHNSTFRPSCSNNCFPAAGNWTSPAVIQFSVTPLSTSDRTSLIANTFTDYLYPSSGSGGSTPYYDSRNNFANQGNITGNACSASGVNGYTCSASISNLPNIAAGSFYTVNFINYYDTSNISITGNDNSARPVQFKNAQVMIDVTGQAKNVLKRLQVRVPYNNSGVPDYAIQAQNVCKRLEATPSNTFGTQSIDVNGGNPSPGSACYLGP